jgi:hypothetical protein
MKTLIKIVSLIMFSVGFICWGLGYTMQNNAQSYDHMSQHLVAVNQKATKSLATTTAQKQPLVSATNDFLNKFFMLDWTFANQAAFDAKRASLKPYVTAEVYQKALDLQPDKNKMVDQTGVIVTFASVDFMPEHVASGNVDGKAVVAIHSNNPDQPVATTRFVYHIAYNPKTKCIMTLDRQGEFVVTGDTQGEQDESKTPTIN